MKTTKIALAGLLAVAVAVLAGYLWGSSGRRAADREREASILRADLLEARSAVLAARVEIYNVNFGNAGGHLQDALDRLGPAATQMKELSRPEDATRLERAATKVKEAQQLAGKLDLGANARAADAAAAINEVLQNGAKR
jgi:hypothetical protein